MKRSLNDDEPTVELDATGSKKANKKRKTEKHCNSKKNKATKRKQTDDAANRNNKKRKKTQEIKSDPLSIVDNTLPEPAKSTSIPQTADATSTKHDNTTSHPEKKINKKTKKTSNNQAPSTPVKGMNVIPPAVLAAPRPTSELPKISNPAETEDATTNGYSWSSFYTSYIQPYIPQLKTESRPSFFDEEVIIVMIISFTHALIIGYDPNLSQFPKSGLFIGETVMTARFGPRFALELTYFLMTSLLFVACYAQLEYWTRNNKFENYSKLARQNTTFRFMRALVATTIVSFSCAVMFDQLTQEEYNIILLRSIVTFASSLHAELLWTLISCDFNDKFSYTPAIRNLVFLVFMLASASIVSTINQAIMGIMIFVLCCSVNHLFMFFKAGNDTDHGNKLNNHMMEKVLDSMVIIISFGSYLFIDETLLQDYIDMVTLNW